MKIKRLFDITASSLGLIFLFPFFVVVPILIKIDSKGPVFYQQKRVGRGFKEFNIYKFRSMMVDSESRGPQITVRGDKRVTKIGKVLRKYKFDELPQLINVIKGDMSFVGPRPEVKKYVEIFRSDYEKLLQIRPGITDPASLQYSNEEKMLSMSQNWEDDYINKVLPNKIKLSSLYVDKCEGILYDIKLIFKTIIKI